MSVRTRGTDYPLQRRDQQKAQLFPAVPRPSTASLTLVPYWRHTLLPTTGQRLIWRHIGFGTDYVSEEVRTPELSEHEGMKMANARSSCPQSSFYNLANFSYSRLSSPTVSLTVNISVKTSYLHTVSWTRETLSTIVERWHTSSCHSQCGQDRLIHKNSALSVMHLVMYWRTLLLYE